MYHTVGGYGAPVFGLHLYIWVLLIFFVSILIIALLLLDGKRLKATREEHFISAQGLKGFIKTLFGLLFFLTLANFFTTLLIFGIGPCPDDPVSYQLLKSKWL
ncbi:hypothetical protein [Bacteroidetes bacterium endosymbiont of Geopemphigus sp.]|uniref:hypothetical protein n=1 Tax=Bacteroidetes bacterium endosymbiont of Geopemphigus sp. TaxID=2047937 RepID=UPI000CD1238F|nr:hypothetical protein [Bacteroidetes bacterium endosymbiont of Geopemphigus sp.]